MMGFLHRQQGVLMVNGFLAKQHACMGKGGNDRSLCFPNGLSDKAQSCLFGHPALFIDRADNGQIQLSLFR